MKILFIVVFIISGYAGLFAQQKITIADLRLSFETFEYSEVIAKADELLKGRDTINTGNLLDILQMKAISHYAMADEPGVRKSFIEMLQQDRFYQLDSEKVSPKIIKLFSEVKTDYLQSVSDKKKEVITGPVYKTPDYKEVSFKYREEKESITRSFIYPGWGHLYSGSTLKGSIIFSLTAANIGALVYFIFDTNKKHTSYLNERDPILLKEKYSSYNKSYKVRNILIGSLVAVYAYTQIDILFLNKSILPEISTLETSLSLPSTDGIQLNWNIHF